MKPQIDDIRAGMEQRPTEELMSILRSRDEEEWRPEVFDIVTSILAARGVSTADVAAIEPEGEDIVEDQPLVTVGHFVNPGEAHTARLALESMGITAWVADEDIGIGLGSRLQVRVEDEASAAEILQGDPVPASDMPAELAEPPCPRCGSRSVSTITEVVDPESPLGAGRGGRLQRNWLYECGSCGNRWPDESE